MEKLPSPSHKSPVSNINRNVPSIAASMEQELGHDVNLLSTKALRKLLNQIDTEIVFLIHENKLLEGAVKEAEQVVGPIKLMEKSVPWHRASSVRSASSASTGSLPRIVGSEANTRMSIRRKSRLRSMLMEIQPTLHVKYKCYIAFKKHRDMESVLENLEQSRGLKIHELQAKLAVVDMETMAVEAEKCDFNQLIKINGKHPVTKRIMGEKVHRYLEDSLKKKQIATERMRAIASHCKMLEKKVIQQIEEKKELSLSLHQVDLQKVQVHHQKCCEKMKDCNRRYLQLKARSNRSVQALTDFKKKMDNEIMLLTTAQKQIAWQEKLRKVIACEKSVFNQQKLQLERAKKKIEDNPRKQLLPKIMEYVHLKAVLKEKEKEVRSWKSKVIVAEQAQFLHFSSVRPKFLI